MLTLVLTKFCLVGLICMYLSRYQILDIGSHQTVYNIIYNEFMLLKDPEIIKKIVRIY